MSGGCARRGRRRIAGDAQGLRRATPGLRRYSGRMKAGLSVIFALASAGVLSCGGGQSSPTATASVPAPTAAPSRLADLGPPFTIIPAQPAASVDFTAPGYFVLDTTSGLVERIAMDTSPQRLAAQGSAGLKAAFCGDNLVIGNRSAPEPDYIIYPDGQLQRGSARNCDQIAERGGQSPDGKWTAAVDTSGALATVSVSDASGSPAYRITNASSPVWSPAGGATLAVLGSLCGAFDVLLIDPAAGTMRNLTANVDVIPEFVWRPDGRAIAIDLVPGGDYYRRVLGLVDVSAGTLTELVSIPYSGELIPVGYNASGDRLLFGYNGGRGLCDDGRPLPQPASELQPVGNQP